MEIVLLGAVGLVDGEELLQVRGSTQRQLLAILAARRRAVVGADWLADTLGVSPGGLRASISRLRRVVGADVVVSRSRGYVFATDTVDIAAFESLLAAAKGRDPPLREPILAQALGLWRGRRPFAEFADLPWAMGEAARLDELRWGAVEDRADALIELGRCSDASAVVQGLLTSEPLRERGRAMYMKSLALQGRSAEALRSYRDFRRYLGDEIGVEPSEELQALERAILDGTVKPIDRRTGYGAIGTAPQNGVQERLEGDASPTTARARSLPAPTDPILGRERELDTVRSMIESGSLVTVAGVGGTGKTRLAEQLALALADAGGPAVVFVELAAVSDRTGVIDALAMALSIQTGQRVDLLHACEEYLGAVDHIVFLDNCEHVLEPVGELLRQLLSACRGLKVVTTSRERVGHPAERVFRLDPLPVPVEARTESGAANHPAVLQLFADRAQRVHPEFELDAVTTPKVHALCTSLDGLPLAVELAAGRLAALDIDDLRARLDRRLDLLGAARGSPDDRHRTLRATLSWSYDLLDPETQRLLRFLAVFPGGVTLAAAEWLGDRIELATDPVVGVTRLVDTSVVGRAETRSGTRYRQLETIRAFGLDRLDHHGERDLARTVLVDWTRAFTRQVAEWAISPDEEVWNDRVRDELPNLRAARAEMLRNRDVEAAVALSKDLNDWCQLRGVAEICQWSAELVDLTADIDRDDRAEALAMAAQSAWLLGRLDESRSLAESVLARGGSMSARANALSALGAAAMFQGRLGDATAAWLARDEIDPDPIDLAAAALAAVYAGDRDRGDTLLVRAKAEAATRGAPSDRAWLEYITGEMAWYHGTGDHETHLRRAISLAQQVGTEFIEGVATVTLVSSRAREQHGATAATGFAELIELWLRTGSWTQLWTTLHNVAEFLVGKDDATALLLLEAAGADPDAPTLPEPARGVEIDLRAAIVVRLGASRAAEISAGAATSERGAVAETALTSLRRLADQQR